MKKRSRFRCAPKDLLDLSYIIGVAEGSIPRDPMAYPAFLGEPPRAEDYADRERAYNLGRHQGWYCELGERCEKPTPPVGMPRALLPSFAAGILDGAESVRMVRALSKPGGSSDPYDPWADLDGDFSAI